jgi:hypothetical protein
MSEGYSYFGASRLRSSQRWHDAALARDGYRMSMDKAEVGLMGEGGTDQQEGGWQAKQGAEFEGVGF